MVEAQTYEAWVIDTKVDGFFAFKGVVQIFRQKEFAKDFLEQIVADKFPESEVKKVRVAIEVIQ